MLITRREAIRTLGLGAVGLGALPILAQTLSAADTEESGTEFVLPPLPYGFDALEPAIDTETMEIHHGKHHAAYVANLNAAVAKEPALAGKSIESLLSDLASVPESVRQTVRDNGGGHYNHSLFWESLSPKGGEPEGGLGAALDEVFGGADAFREGLRAAGLAVFGSGWAWLSLTPEKRLVIETTPNQDNPIFHGNLPLFGVDVWEHAYYLLYQNRRAEYLNAVCGLIDWPTVALRYQRASL